MHLPEGHNARDEQQRKQKAQRLWKQDREEYYKEQQPDDRSSTPNLSGRMWCILAEGRMVS